jgi:putative transposase
MPRPARIAPKGVIFHIINRGVGRRELFADDRDYAAFERVLAYALSFDPVQLLAYCLMPNHWHLVVCPTADGQLARFMQRLTSTHSRRWQGYRQQVGFGHLYQGRYKSFPVQDDHHFLTVVRYVERNALRAGLVTSAEQWRWSSLWRHLHPGGGKHAPLPLTTWPVDPPADWLAIVNESPPEAELNALQVSLAKGKPFGEPIWQESITKSLSLGSTHRPRGRPKKDTPRQNSARHNY